MGYVRSTRVGHIKGSLRKDMILSKEVDKVRGVPILRLELVRLPRKVVGQEGPRKQLPTAIIHVQMVHEDEATVGDLREAHGVRRGSKGITNRKDPRIHVQGILDHEAVDRACGAGRVAYRQGLRDGHLGPVHFDDARVADLDGNITRHLQATGRIHGQNVLSGALLDGIGGSRPDIQHEIGAGPG
eukprot:scaffold2601_cov198-Pinguiococcus_pyrenoidosus.AAC.8